VLDPQSYRQTNAQYRRGVGKNPPYELLLRGFVHCRIPALWTDLNCVRDFEICPSRRCTPRCYSRVKRAITVPTTGEGSRATKIDSYSGLNEASSIVGPFIEATRFTT